MKTAELLLIREIQRKHFKEEIRSMLKGEVRLKRSPNFKHKEAFEFVKTHPFIDDENVVRVGGRIDASMQLSFEEKHPIVLPGRDVNVEALITDTHRMLGHVGIEHVFNHMRGTYWILHTRQTIKRVLASCVICQKRHKPAAKQLMGPLPAERVDFVYPFRNVGIDPFGPFKVHVGE